MFHIVFYTPEIPPNTGNAMRLCAVTGCSLHLIRPLGFDMDEPRLRRAGMDYRDKATVTVHDSVEDFLQTQKPSRVLALTVDGEVSYGDVSYLPGDFLFFGPESVGLPDHLKRADWVDERVRIPMVEGVRSLNLSNSAAIVVYEAWRQNGFDGSV